MTPTKLIKGPIRYAYDHERWYCRIYEGSTEVAQAIGMGRGKKGQDECEAHAQRIMQALEPKGQALPEMWSEEKLDSLAEHVDRNTADHIRALQRHILSAKAVELEPQLMASLGNVLKDLQRLPLPNHIGPASFASLVEAFEKAVPGKAVEWRKVREKLEEGYRLLQTNLEYNRGSVSALLKETLSLLPAEEEVSDAKV